MMWPQSEALGVGGGEDSVAPAMYQCPGCPSPAYLPPEDIPRHDAAQHKQETFKCLACWVRPVSHWSRFVETVL